MVCFKNHSETIEMPSTLSVIVETEVLIEYQDCLLGVNPDHMLYLLYHFSFLMDFFDHSYDSSPFCYLL
jgi:hypothetical protein